MYQQNQYPNLNSISAPEKQDKTEFPETWFSDPNKNTKTVPFSKSLFLNSQSLQQVMTPPSPSQSGIFPKNKTVPLQSQIHNRLLQSSSSPSTSYWSNNFIVTFAPFLIWGCPSHLLFGQKRITTTSQWFKSLCPCASPLALLATIITCIVALIAIILNAYTFFIIGHFFYILIIQADLSNSLLFTYLLSMFRFLPVIIPIDLIWLKGHSLRKLIASFDRVTDNYNNLRMSPMAWGVEGFPKVPGCRIKLALLYFLIICIHVLHILTDESIGLAPASTMSRDKNLSSMAIEDLVVTIVGDYSLATGMTLLFPLYCTFCWALMYELMMLKGYIKTLIRAKVTPKYSHFDEFKKSYRQVADHIMHVNKIFSIYLSVIIVVLITYIFADAFNLSSKVFLAFFPTNSLGLGFKAIKGMLEGVLGQPPPTQQQPGGADPTQITIEPLSPEKVRLIIGNVLVIVFYFAMFGLTYWQAVRVNDEVRYLHVWLNDFVSEPESKVSQELYCSFQLLKFYIHSRLEQQKPAFLSILIFNFIPSLQKRLLLYKVVH